MSAVTDSQDRCPFPHLTWLRQAAVLGLALVVPLLPASARAAPGDLDPSFSRDGKARTEFASKRALAFAIAPQPDGKSVVAGRGGGKFVLARYRHDGRLDRSFSDDGKVKTDFAQPGGASSVAVQRNGRIVAAGRAGEDFALARYQSDGGPDHSFSSDGKLTTDFADSDSASGVAVQPNGRIVAVGRSERDFALARYKPDGRIDRTFSGDGKVITDFGSFPAVARSVALQPDGKIVAFGSYEGPFDEVDFALARYNPDGTLDSSFSGDGKEVTDVGAIAEGRALALQPDGNILVAGSWWLTYDDIDFVVARYTANGSLDPTFSGDGVATTDFAGDAEAHALALQSDGNVIAAGRACCLPTGTDFALARYNPDGSLDASFAGNGLLTTDYITGNDFVRGLALQPGGRIIAAGSMAGIRGTRGSKKRFALARYELSDGPPDTDADGIEDVGDRCPSQYGRKSSGCPRHRRSLTLRYNDHDLRFEGELSSPFPPCERDGKVRIFKSRPGQDPEVAADETDFKGHYSVLDPGFEGVYYARSPRTFEAEVGICARVRSRELKL